jgi:hypothetical protein
MPTTEHHPLAASGRGHGQSLVADLLQLVLAGISARASAVIASGPIERKR